MRVSYEWAEWLWLSTLGSSCCYLCCCLTLSSVICTFIPGNLRQDTISTCTPVTSSPVWHHHLTLTSSPVYLNARFILLNMFNASVKRVVVAASDALSLLINEHLQFRCFWEIKKVRKTDFIILAWRWPDLKQHLSSVCFISFAAWDNFLLHSFWHNYNH